MFIIEHAIERSKAEILEDIAQGTVPDTVSSFSELHDYVDANEYGGLCEEGTWWSLADDATDKELADNHGFFLRHFDQSAAVQDAVHAWLLRRIACREIGHKFEYAYDLNYDVAFDPSIDQSEHVISISDIYRCILCDTLEIID